MGHFQKVRESVLSGMQDNKAKAYQVKHVRNLILKYKLGGES